jgi:hypothetical protein
MRVIDYLNETGTVRQTINDAVLITFLLGNRADFIEFCDRLLLIALKLHEYFETNQSLKKHQTQPAINELPKLRDVTGSSVKLWRMVLFCRALNFYPL